jgi:PLP dependent protein
VEPGALQSRVADNLACVQANIAQATTSHLVTLVCVTKYAQDDWVTALLEAGATDLAENLLPRASERFTALKAQGYKFTRHLIGAQQSRKVKFIAGQFDWLQALDRMDCASELEQLLILNQQRLDVLVQINIGREETKHGFMPEEAEDVCGRVLEHFTALRLRGLMAIPPWPSAYPNRAAFERETRIHFRQMSELFARIRHSFPGAPLLDTLSLGMSQDYVWAIEEGATMVRVGSALFEGLEG